MFHICWLISAIILTISENQCINAFQTLESLQVNTDNGPVRGYLRKSSENHPFIAFEGIPYAKPPLGELRFQSPQEPSPWSPTTPLNANKSYLCLQFLPAQFIGDAVLGQEDCLYVNIYIPGDRLDMNRNRKYPVVVHIHGGAFVLGAPKMMAGPKYIMNHEVIYVNFNYRLGIFGFLSTQDASASGNYGLKDQNAALKWIHHNIGAFGGDPHLITLTGQSAGSASVHYHVLSEKSRGLFQKAVLISGTALNPWALTENPLAKARKLGQIMNCTGAESKELVDCLRKVPGQTLARGIQEMFHFANVLPITLFGPVVERIDEPDAFITKSPFTLLDEQANTIGSDVPMIFSFVKDEGIFPSGYFAMLNQIDNMKRRWFDVMPYGLDLQDTCPEDEWQDTLAKIKDYYFPQDDLRADNVGNLTLLFSDRLYLIPLQKALRLHLQSQQRRHNIYLYMFDYDSPAFNVFPSVPGVAHSEDLQLMFDLYISPAHHTEEDRQMSEFLTRMLVNFAKDTTDSAPFNDWRPLKNATDSFDYYYITNSSGNKMETRQEIAPASFWNDLPIHEEY